MAGNLTRPEKGRAILAEWGQTVTDLLNQARGEGGIGANGTVIDVLEANENVDGAGSFDGVLTQFKDGDWQRQAGDKVVPISKRFTEGFMPEDGQGIFWMNNVSQIAQLLTTGALLTWGQLTEDWDGSPATTIVSDIPLKGVSGLSVDVYDAIGFLGTTDQKLLSGSTIVAFFVNAKWTLIGAVECPVPVTPATNKRGAIVFGSGAPSSTDGIDGDAYVNTSNGDMYGPKAAGAWPSTPFNTSTPPPGP